MAAAEKTVASRGGEPLTPPEERFWQRYSSHYELPLAGATSFFAHGLIVAILAVGGLAFLFKASAEASRPPQMDVLFVEDSGGFGGIPGDPGLPGLPGEQSRTEAGPPTVGDPDPRSEPTPPGMEELPPVPGMELEFPPAENSTDPSEDLIQQLKKLGLDAEKRAKEPTPKPANPSKGGVVAKSSGPKGDGGQGGSGGTGGKGGPGKGGPGGFGRKATEQEIKAWRWRFDLTGTPKEHAEKLDKAGLLIAVPDPTKGKVDPKTGPHLFVRDLKLRPAMVEPGDFAKYEDAVKWYNSKPESVRGLAQELQLEHNGQPFVPAYIVLLLPKDREAKMAAEEKRFALKNRMSPAAVQETWFDFQMRNGVYEPLAIKQR